MTVDEEHAVSASEPSTIPNLRVGDVIEVRSEAEILATLDERGELDSLPFMPEMLAFAGRTLTVEKVANKTCDTITQQGMRKMENAVHLTTARCDGSAHGGCENQCLIHWRTEWLKRPGDPSAEPAGPARITLPLLQAATRKAPEADGEERFACQATELNRASEQQSLLDLEQYVIDYKSGNAGVWAIVTSFLVGLVNWFQRQSTKRLPSRLQLRGGRRWPFLAGKAEGRTPTVDLGLQPGDRVRIKSRDEIMETLNGDLLNRGLGFDGEMARFCGREAVVDRRVHQVINEKTSRMVRMKTPCIVLKGIVCEGAYAVNCPRRWISFWREIWLERVDDK